MHKRKAWLAVYKPNTLIITSMVCEGPDSALVTTRLALSGYGALRTLTKSLVLSSLSTGPLAMGQLVQKE